MSPGRGQSGGHLRLIGLAAWRGVGELYNSDGLTHAASVAYYALISLFPFLLLSLSILGEVTSDAAERDEVVRFVFRYFPRQFDFITGQLDSFQTSPVSFGAGGLLMLVWASTGVFNALTSAVNHAWGVEKRRSFLKHRLVSFMMLVAAGGSTILGLMLVSAIRVAESSWFGVLLLRFQWLTTLQTFTFQYLATIVLIVSVGLVFYFIPNAKTRFRDVWVGAVLTGLLWRVAFDGFAWYVTGNSRMSQIQGSITTVVVFLLWIYVSAVILMYGVEFTAAYARLRRRRPDQMPAAATPRT